MPALVEPYWATFAQKHFAFLISDYNFTLDEVHLGTAGPPRQERAAWVRWVSPVAQVRVSFDNDINAVDIGPVTNPLGKLSWYDIGNILCFKTKGQNFDLYISSEERWKHDRRDLPAAMDEELAHVAAGLRQNFDEMLRGDFSLLPQLDEWLDNAGFLLAQAGLWDWEAGRATYDVSIDEHST